MAWNREQSLDIYQVKLTSQAADNLAYLVSQLRHEHLFCFWCATKYSSWEEMEGPGGCPGEEEDDH